MHILHILMYTAVTDCVRMHLVCDRCRMDMTYLRTAANVRITFWPQPDNLEGKHKWGDENTLLFRSLQYECQLRREERPVVFHGKCWRYAESVWLQYVCLYMLFYVCWCACVFYVCYMCMCVMRVRACVCYVCIVCEPHVCDLVGVYGCVSVLCVYYVCVEDCSAPAAVCLCKRGEGCEKVSSELVFLSVPHKMIRHNLSYGQIKLSCALTHKHCIGADNSCGRNTAD